MRELSTAEISIITGGEDAELLRGMTEVIGRGEGDMISIQASSSLTSKENCSCVIEQRDSSGNIVGVEQLNSSTIFIGVDANHNDVPDSLESDAYQVDCTFDSGT